MLCSPRARAKKNIGAATHHCAVCGRVLAAPPRFKLSTTHRSARTVAGSGTWRRCFRNGVSVGSTHSPAISRCPLSVLFVPSESSGSSNVYGGLGSGKTSAKPLENLFVPEPFCRCCFGKCLSAVRRIPLNMSLAECREVYRQELVRQRT